MDYYSKGTRQPWDIGRPQPSLLTVKLVKSNVLDIGSGTGENSLYFAEKGMKTLGIDISPIAVKIAQEKAIRRRIDTAEFQQGDVFNLKALERTFETVIDCGFLHIFRTKDKERIVEQVRNVLKPGGHYVLLEFNENEPSGIGPPNRLTKMEIDQLFKRSKAVRIVESTFESNLEQSPHNAWLCVFRKV